MDHSCQQVVGIGERGPAGLQKQDSAGRELERVDARRFPSASLDLGSE